jgi:N utilization substance protein A
MEQKQFALALSQICEEKGIPKEKAMEIIEAAIAAAYKKDYGEKGQVIEAKFNEETGEVKAYQVKVVAEMTDDEDEEAETVESEAAEAGEEGEGEPKKKFNPEKNITLEEAEKFNKNAKIGDEIRIELPSHSDFGRIAAQTAKQVMIQKIREAEKEAVFEEFKDKEGEVVNGIVQRIEGKNVLVDVGKAVGILYPAEQISGERYQVGQRLKVYIAKVSQETKEANLILSRTSEEIVKKLFELEVPEIYAGTVEIKGVAREAGSRSKVAVTSNEEGIDPVGSCVGQRGARIQTIINELGGEKIDIIEWNDEIKKYIQHALLPAKVANILLDEEKKVATAIVNEDQLSLAIGKNGQNVRLATKLTGWKIDVVERKKEAMEAESESAEIEETAGEEKKEEETETE